MPPLTEQAAIARFLDHVVRRIQRYVSVKQKLITLLDGQKKGLLIEYRDRLIADVVTGKLNVRW